MKAPLAVTLDLDDTLYPQAEFLAGAWAAVAREGEQLGLDRARLHTALLDVCAEGSDRGGIVDRALTRIGAPASLVHPLVEAFSAFRPTRLQPYPGVAGALSALRSLVPVALITDGNPAGQRAKLAALGLPDAFDVVICSDDLGREHRKPDPAPFRAALRALGVDAPHVVHVGDRPSKDVAGALRVGMRAIRVRQGEYADAPDDPRRRPEMVVADTPTALRVLARAVDPSRRNVRVAQRVR